MVWNTVFWSSMKVTFPTPQYVFDLLDSEFHFDLDAAATADNTKCKNFISPEQDALKVADWPGSRIYLNPPYTKGLGHWIQKAFEESRKGKIVVCFVPARVDTRWFHKHCTSPDAEVRFLDHRISFDGKNKAPFPSMVIVFRPPQP
jgi:site-specific DNA-methyltransferase (adenine-specific)